MRLGGGPPRLSTSCSGLHPFPRIALTMKLTFCAFAAITVVAQGRQLSSRNSTATMKENWQKFIKRSLLESIKNGELCIYTYHWDPAEYGTYTDSVDWTLQCPAASRIHWKRNRTPYTLDDFTCLVPKTMDSWVGGRLVDQSCKAPPHCRLESFFVIRRQTGLLPRQARHEDKKGDFLYSHLVLKFEPQLNPVSGETAKPRDTFEAVTVWGRELIKSPSAFCTLQGKDSHPSPDNV
ncbi:unnamed protein product [Vitrella brassicaformis CCMP3155]|uniref:Uncharacterized protein n=1 Tax=Vitrella brassicaformis (strain CCMP3155) TaxID=1169540 RepID=A0A0G4EDH3_VITBC|nr:unnamed protein product [Vitrella brassicaformis CCMP3155]|eukprot:CEL93549.1 unnamed protein product [Vitrella brassicaformis CCMP3155]